MSLHPGTIAARDPNRIAVIIDGATMSYAMLDADSQSIAARLFAMGLRQGDVVASSCNGCAPAGRPDWDRRFVGPTPCSFASAGRLPLRKSIGSWPPWRRRRAPAPPTHRANDGVEARSWGLL